MLFFMLKFSRSPAQIFLLSLLARLSLFHFTRLERMKIIDLISVVIAKELQSFPFFVLPTVFPWKCWRLQESGCQWHQQNYTQFQIEIFGLKHQGCIDLPYHIHAVHIIHIQDRFFGHLYKGKIQACWRSLFYYLQPDNESLMICNLSFKPLTFTRIEMHTRVLVWRYLDNILVSFKTSVRESNISNKFGSRKWSLTYFASASPLSKKITSNASINGWNLEIIITYDSACMSQLTVHAFMECSMSYQRLKAFLFPTLGICSNNSLKTNTQGIKIFWLKMLCDDFTQVNSLFRSCQLDNA